MLEESEARAGAAVEVWVAPLAVAPRILELLVASLNPSERARAARYHFPLDATRFSAARGWLRHVLANELGVSPATVPLSDGPGKPRLVDGPRPGFNVTHAHELCLIALTGEGREVGVDVEHHSAGRHGLESARLAATAEEAAALARMPPGRRADAFLRLWTAKEAYLKALGVGLTVPPHRVEIGGRSVGRAAPVRTAGDAGPRRWWVQELRPTPGYVGAVAAEGRAWRIMMREAAELGLDSRAAVGQGAGER